MLLIGHSWLLDVTHCFANYLNGWVGVGLCVCVCVSYFEMHVNSLECRINVHHKKIDYTFTITQL